MMATSLKHEAFHKNLECPVCLSFFKDPKNLTCSHTFCKGCLETLLESRGKLLCPTCREETSLPGGDVGRLPSNITVRSLVYDVEAQGQVFTNSYQENESLPRKWNKCRKHPNYDEECFCLNCNKFICSMCGLLEHAKDAHTIMEAGEHKTEQKKHVEKLASKADAKIRNVDKYFTFVEDQRKRLLNVQEQLNGEIDATFEESVEKLKERKKVLKKEVEHKLGKIRTSLGDVEKSNFDKGYEAVLVLLDYTAAFDSIDHTTMIDRFLRGYGIKGCALKWLESYLDNRKQHIVVNDSISRSFPLPWGVPQGSVLGPLEFILYTGPLSAVISSHRDIHHVMYADDTQLYVTMTSKDHVGSMHKLSECVSDVMSWSSSNKLKLNQSKTEVLHITSQFRSSCSLPCLDAAGVEIVPSKVVRNLGVTVDNVLNMKQHIRNTCRTAAFGISRISQVPEWSMMATSLKHEAFYKNLECPVCLSFFKEPKILTCSHTFCKGCLETLLESRGKLLCPTCREETSVPGGDVGRLQSNITVRSLVEDVETQGQVCTKSLQRKRNTCRKHPNYDEECFCLNCNKYVCSMCGVLEHAKNGHTILEAGAHETEQNNHVEKLASEAVAKICNVDKYFTFIKDQRKRLHNVQEQLNCEIDATFEELVEKLKERKKVLKNEVGQKLGKLKSSLGDVEKSVRKQTDQIKKVLDLVKNGLNFPLQTEALTSHKAMCQQLKELLNRIGPDEELPRRTAEEGERIGFRSQGSDGLELGQLIHTMEVPAHMKSKWVLLTEARLPGGKAIRWMVISPNNKMAVGCRNGGIFIEYSSDGIIQDIILKSVKDDALHFMPDGGFVVGDTYNRISLYTELCEKLDVTFETMEGDFGGLTVGKDGLIFIGYSLGQKIQVFKPEGGKAIREIRCNGYKPWQIIAMTSNQAIVVKSFCTTSHQYQVQVINDMSGAIIHSISKDGYNLYPAVCQDDSVIIAWVKHGQGLVSIHQYTQELKYIKNILTDFKIIVTVHCFLQAFKTGEIAFCTHDRLYIFHETWE
eukprot:XP_011663633.1 PREDICTED: uncharacterized protein LOC105438026 [Strongylocentrotus purpuratus]